MALLKSSYKCPGPGFTMDHLRKMSVESGIEYSNWGDASFPACSRVTIVAREPCLRGSLSCACSASAKFHARWSGWMVPGRRHLAQLGLEGPPGAVLGLRGWRRASPLARLPALLCVQGPLLCLQIHSHQDVLHILIKVLPWAGRPPDRWL